MTDNNDQAIIENITQVMQQFITPAVAQHGGEVNFVGFENGIVTVQLSGACSGCAGSTMTLKHGIESMLTEMIPEVTSVKGIDDPFSSVDPYYSMDNDVFFRGPPDDFDN